jgi:hypothetical protein
LYYIAKLLINILFIFFAVVSKANTYCTDFLNNNKTRVKQLIEHAQKNDTFWNHHVKYLAIILPEFIAESEIDVENEKNIFKFLNTLNYKAVSEISIGPFQMKPLFIYKILCKSPININSISLSKINDNIDTFSSSNIQLVILKKFILLNKKYMLKDNLNSRILKLSALYNGSIKNYSDPCIQNINFNKIDCLNLPYSKMCLFLMKFYIL